MPKLNATKAAEVAKAGADGPGFTLLPEGKYIVRLTEVESTTSRPKPGEREGNPMWVWHFESVEFLEETPKDDKGVEINLAGKELRYWTVIQDNTLWDLDRVFAAFKAPADTDTDELIGDQIVVMVDQQVITKGKLKGKMGNNVVDFFTLEEGGVGDDLDVLIGAAAGGSKDDPGF